MEIFCAHLSEEVTRFFSRDLPESGSKLASHTKGCLPLRAPGSPLKHKREVCKNTEIFMDNSLPSQLNYMHSWRQEAAKGPTGRLGTPLIQLFLQA